MTKENHARRPTVTGTYQLKLRGGAGGTIRVLQLSPTSIKFELEFNRGRPSYNMGWASGTLALASGVATHTVTNYGAPCKIVLKFEGNKVIVSQDGSDFDCGFGHAVYCSGTYLLKSHKPPKIAESAEERLTTKE